MKKKVYFWLLALGFILVGYCASQRFTTDITPNPIPNMPTWVATNTSTPYPSYRPPPTLPPTLDPRIPPDPGHGPLPVCWTQPTTGYCPPRR